MAEISRPWSGIVTGDAGPYSDDQWMDVWKTLLGPVIASQGVFIDQLNGLVLAGLAATPITIDTGRALVNGIWYENNVIVDVAIPTPAANPRVDRIVLRADWVLQTVRIFRLAGAEAAAPVPAALVQVDGVTWDLPLWQVFITVGGVISTWRDEREFIGQYVPLGVSAARLYLDNEFFGDATPANGDQNKEFQIEFAGGGDVNQIDEAAFGSGGWSLEHDGIGGGARAGIVSQYYKSDLIDAHLVWRVKNPNSDGNLDRVLGFVTQVSSLTPTDGVFFRSDGAGNWFAVCRAGGVEAGSVTDTGQALDDTWRLFEIRQTGTAVVVFLIDGVVVATHQANIPSDVAQMSLNAHIFDNAVAPAAAEYMHADYVTLGGNR